MPKTFTNWQGQLMGTWHSSPGGIKTVITRLTAVNPEVCTIYYTHPHLAMKGTKAGPNSRMMSVRAPAPEVFEWLCTYQHVSVPTSLSNHITLVDRNTLQAIECIVYAELQENVAAQKKVTTSPLQQSFLVNAMGRWVTETTVERYTNAVKIEPWYFVDFTEYSENKGKTKKTWLSIEAVDLMEQIFDPARFSTLDHEKVFNHLMKIKLETLVGVWLLKPGYFDILQVLHPERWNQLLERANKGLMV